MTNQGEFRFSNIVGVMDASTTIANGISPSNTRVLVEPSLLDAMEQVSTAQWWFDGLLIRQFPFSKASDVSTVDSGGLRMYRVSILDRRWGWAMGQISGEYNIKRKGKVIPERDKSPWQLAELLFRAMGESSYDYSLLPNDDRPYVRWEVANPAKSLAELCDLYQCEVSLQLDDSVKIVKKGFGDKLPGIRPFPNTPRTSYERILDLPESPKSVVGVSAETRWQISLKLIPVGYEDGGTEAIPIDDLTYAPKGGTYVDYHGDTIKVPWHWDVVAELNGGVDLSWITKNDNEELDINEEPMDDTEKLKVRIRNLVDKHLFKTFQISIEDIKTDPAPELPLDPEWKPPKDIALKGGLSPILSLKQLLPVSSELLETEGKGEYEKPLDAIVWGRFYDGGVVGNTFLFPDILTPAMYSRKIRYKGSFTVEEETGLVTFGQPMRVRYADERNPERPELFLVVTVQLNHPDTNAPQRYGKSVSIDPTSPAGDAYRVRDDILPGYTQKTNLDESNKRISVWRDNIPEVSEQMGFFLEQAKREFITYPAETATWAGFLPANTDGAIQQISYTIDGSGTCSTGMSRNCELDQDITGYKEARRNQLLTALLEKREVESRQPRMARARQERILNSPRRISGR